MQVYIWISWICGAVILVDGIRQPQSAWVSADRNRGFWLFWLVLASLIALGPVALLFYWFAVRARFASATATPFTRPPAVAGPGSPAPSNLPDNPRSASVPPVPLTVKDPSLPTPARTIPLPPNTEPSSSTTIQVGGLTVDETELVETLEELLGAPPHRAMPAFGTARLGAGAHAQLGLQWDDGPAFVPGPDESILMSWSCSTISGGVARPRLPTDPPPGQGPQPIVNAFTGSGAMALTDRRLIGSVGMGDSVFGLIAPSDDRIVLFTVGLEQIDRVGLMRDNASGDAQFTGVSLHLVNESLILVHYDAALDGQRIPQPIASQRDVADAVVKAVVDLRLPLAQGDEIDVLDRAIRGDWEDDGAGLFACLRTASSARGVG
jgi:hypothetical protein